MDWIRLNREISSVADERTLCGILASYGIPTRIVYVKKTNRGSPKHYIEFVNEEPIVIKEYEE